MERFHIVGQGLAGTALAWRCHQRGLPFRLVDEDREHTASKVAAGIVTPIAGQRLALTQGWSFLEEMETFYGAIGSLLGEIFYRRHETVRFLANALERERWAKRRGDPRYERELASENPLLSEALFDASQGAFAMRRSGFLHVRAWLEASRAWFRERGLMESGTVYPEDCTPDDGLWVFANGAWLLGLNAFDWLPMRYAHGDILTLAIPDLGEDQRIFNGGCWLLPLGGGRWRAGSTYEPRPTPETAPSSEGRALIEANLRAFLKCDYTVEDHVAAVRPVTLTRFPIMGRHPGKPHLAWFGGFSSKGVLTSPAHASRFLDHLLTGEALPEEVDMR